MKITNSFGEDPDLFIPRPLAAGSFIYRFLEQKYAHDKDACQGPFPSSNL